MKLTRSRIAAVVTAAVVLVGTYALYRGDFWSLRTEAQQVEAIRNYCSFDKTGNSLQATLHPVVVHDRTFGKERVLVFADEEIPALMGNIQFRRGILGGWQPMEARYDTARVQSDTLHGQRTIRIVYAADCPAEITHYKVQANLDQEQTLMAEGDVTEPAFLHVYETSRDYFPALYVYGADGTDLTPEYLRSDPGTPSPSIGTAESNLIYCYCGILLLAGWFVVRYLWDGGQKKEDL